MILNLAWPLPLSAVGLRSVADTRSNLELFLVILVEMKAAMETRIGTN